MSVNEFSNGIAQISNSIPFYWTLWNGIKEKFKEELNPQMKLDATAIRIYILTSYIR